MLNGVTAKWLMPALIVVQVVSLVSVSSAESAWVLWSKIVSIEGETEGVEDIGGRFWEVQNAFKDRQQCEREATNYISVLEGYNRKNGDVTVRKDEFAGRTRLYVHYRSSKHTASFSAVCLPETVDPRPRTKE